MNKKEAVIHYEEMARAALYPELVEVLTELVNRFEYVCPDAENEIDEADGLRILKVRALLSRLPAEP